MDQAPAEQPAPAETVPRTLDEILALAHEVVASGKPPKKEVVLSLMRDLLAHEAIIRAQDVDEQRIGLDDRTDQLTALAESLDARERLLREAEEEFLNRPLRSAPPPEPRRALILLASQYRGKPPVPVTITDTRKIHLPLEANAYYTMDGALALAAALLRAVGEIES